MTMIDISRRLHNGIPVWPGDAPFRLEKTWTLGQNSSANVSQLSMSVHTGTHVDAPCHVDNGGQSALELPLDVFVGAARVIDVSGGLASMPTVWPRSICPGSPGCC